MSQSLCDFRECFYLGIYLVIYCVIHSVLADFDLMKKFYFKWWYRATYVFLSIVLLIPAYLYYLQIDSRYFFNPPLIVKIVLYLVSFLSVVFGYFASKSYDNDSFLGLRQIKEFFRYKKKEFVEIEEFTADGVLSVVRHPYYLAGLVIIWSRPLKYKDLVVNIVFTLYFIIGALNEERKLIKIYGEKYLKYKKEVPMFIPKVNRLTGRRKKL